MDFNSSVGVGVQALLPSEITVLSIKHTLKLKI